ncbi:hypothetical protein ACFFR3_45740 [Nonomuraea salmonea]|uniref:Uncharacterized protein n=1 Tax=Nonomuraea salmonea TaxID=46181 RepID=A0ABV5P2N8_9ACTN
MSRPHNHPAPSPAPAGGGWAETQPGLWKHRDGRYVILRFVVPADRPEPVFVLRKLIPGMPHRLGYFLGEHYGLADAQQHAERDAWAEAHGRDSNVPETLPGALAVERFFLPISNGTEVAGLAVVREEGRVYARVVAMGRVTDAYELSTFAQVDVTDVAEQERAALLAEIDRLKGRIDAMEDDCTLLSALQAAGVDNWDGYGYAHELMREWDQGDGR